EPEHKDLYGEALVFELYIREKVKARPKWASDLSVYNRQIGRTLHDMGYDRKYCHAELFHYGVSLINPRDMLQDIDEIGYTEEAQWILFDYEKRNPLSREAEIRKLEI
ncbi:MAG: hypothetical protein ACI4EF_12365, partial [Coprococcus sp.]